MSIRPSSTSNEFVYAGPSVPIETAGTSDSSDDQRVSRLSRLIEGEIVPRLLMCHTVTSRALGLTRVTARPSCADVAKLARLMLEPEHDLANAYLESISLRGASRWLICADLLAPTARHLGELWEKDECDFVEFTDGLRRLESVLHEFRAG